MAGALEALAACTQGEQNVYLDNKDYLLAKCGSNEAVAQLLHCTAQMAVDLAYGPAPTLEGDLCTLQFTPVLERGYLRALPSFPCSAFGYMGVGKDAENAVSLALQVNASAICSWVLSYNQTTALANNFGPFCNSGLTPLQQQGMVFGRCLTVPRFKIEASPSGGGGNATMARTIGLAVGMVVLAGIIGVGLAWYFLKKQRRVVTAGAWCGSGGGAAVDGDAMDHGSRVGGVAGAGVTGGVGVISRHHHHPSHQGGNSRMPAIFGATSAAADPRVGSTVGSLQTGTAYTSGIPATAATGGGSPAQSRQLQGLQGQQRRQQAAQPQQQGQPAVATLSGAAAAASPQQQPRMHHWRPVAARPSARESPFASLLEEEEEEDGAIRRQQHELQQTHRQQQLHPQLPPQAK